jgi:hypothetical protein
MLFAQELYMQNAFHVISALAPGIKTAEDPNIRSGPSHSISRSLSGEKKKGDAFLHLPVG